jgi:hypothetical protein
MDCVSERIVVAPMICLPVTRRPFAGFSAFARDSAPDFLNKCKYGRAGTDEERELIKMKE